MGNPPVSLRYSRLEEVGVDPETLTYASIFSARYRLAAAFEGIRAEGIGKTTLGGYERLMRLLLVQTALEALKKVTGSPVRVESESLAARLRADQGLVEVLLDPEHRHIDRRQKKGQDATISALGTGEHSDMSAVLRRVRNMFAHGDSTSNRFALDRMKSRRELFTDLADLGLHCANDTFTIWVEGQLSSNSR